MAKMLLERLYDVPILALHLQNRGLQVKKNTESSFVIRYSDSPRVYDVYVEENEKGKYDVVFYEKSVRIMSFSDITEDELKDLLERKCKVLIG